MQNNVTEKFFKILLAHFELCRNLKKNRMLKWQQ